MLDEHWTNWLARKSAKTHFLRPGKSSPPNNSDLLYDGSAEARAILSDAIKSVIAEPASEDGLIAVVVLRNSLDYLKGKNAPRFSFTSLFFVTKEATNEPENSTGNVQDTL